MTRDELMAKLDGSRAELEALLARVPAERRTLPALSNGWSVKDLLAHLATWEKRVLYLYGRLSTGRPVEDTISDLNEFNAAAYQANRDRPLAEIQAEEAQAYADLRHLAQTAPEAHLFDPAHFPWTQGMAFYEMIGNNSYGHFDEHMPDLRAWLEG